MSESKSPAPSTPTGPHLDKLPSEVKLRIASFLSRTEALALTLTCQSLLEAGESNLYHSLDLLFHPLHASVSVDPALHGDAHRATPTLREKARLFGDVDIRGSQPESDLLQGGLRYYSRSFAARPARRGYVREIYADCMTGSSPPRLGSMVEVGLAPSSSTPRTQPDPSISSDIKRTFRTLGSMRSVVKLTLRVYYQWEDYLRQFLTVTPNVQRIVLLPQGRLAEQVSRMPELPSLKHFAVEGLYPQLAPLTAHVVERARQLRGLVIMDWDEGLGGQAQRQGQGQRQLAINRRPDYSTQVADLYKAIEKRRGIKMLSLPKRLFDELKCADLVRTEVLGIQGPYHPSLRFADITIPSVPRVQRLIFFLNRSSTFTPFHTATRLPEQTEITCAPIHSTLMDQIESSPRLVDIHLSNLFQPQSPGRVHIRTFARPGDKLTHVRVTSNQVYYGGQWMMVSRGSATQDWTDYRGACVPRDLLQAVYQEGKLDLERHRGGREMKLADPGWKVLENWWSGVSTV